MRQVIRRDAFPLQLYILFPLFAFPALSYLAEFSHCRNSSRHKIPDPADGCSTRKALLALCRLSRRDREYRWQDRITVQQNSLRFTCNDIRLGSITHVHWTESDFVSASSNPLSENSHRAGELKSTKKTQEHDLSSLLGTDRYKKFITRG